MCFHRQKTGPKVAVRALYVVGPSSTGKTTLCNAIVENLGIPKEAYITEVARTVMRTTGFSREDVGKLEMQSAILEAQLEREEEAREAARAAPGSHTILSDRSAIDPIVYAILTASNENEANHRRRTLTEKDGFRRALPRYQHAEFILLEPVPEWLVDDGVRSLDNHVECSRVFKEVLEELGIAYTVINAETKDLAERVEVALNLLTPHS
ncbi:hypothetical protein JAAARDRAFT_136621 [Jaapia argillacea MUCL 33604]|uniref:NadR/Ttd14 AAA domain-containing protein n=1 Tax=Jaapia argillacea MUCL 33604 TaxID=933084 RepID=A0A067PR42_9AGAM|nr:hypothetical protein JAAARDRAFT_136621 [Jaapia argillacea MUCL 33604]